jgi:dihydroxyacetone kinase
VTRLHNDPALFMEEMLEGFLDAYSGSVLGVPGGVVRADQPARGKVAVIVGGGSGHYPAFAGIVGPGFADGAVVGNVFTSPSADDAYHVARAAENGGGVIITSGNYAGDVLHFTAAAEKLTKEGVPSRVVFVTDDVASAPESEREKRRGIAGDFVVFKIMGAAAEAGADLDDVLRLGEKANDHTRTLGVAFSGCTLPGASEPLFTVPAGKMGVGLGIHGEPGVSEDTLPTAESLAEVLVRGAVQELGLTPGDRIGAILNGLGATKYEELFLVWRTVAALLRELGLVVIDPEVGELVTSLDMAGCSLTIVSLDDELEQLWRAPAYTPAYRKGSIQSMQTGTPRIIREDLTQQERVGEASHAAQACGQRTIAILGALREAIVAAEDELGRIDAVAGDGDHGRGMVKGIEAAVRSARVAADQGAGVGSVLRAAGHAWESKAGGTSGALWGAALTAVGDDLGDDKEAYSSRDIAAALRKGFDQIRHLGKAELGDKSMLDSYGPFLDTLDDELEGGASLAAAWQAAAVQSEQAALATASLRPNVGRARPLAERSIGTPDAGATSLALCFVAASKVIAHA